MFLCFAVAVARYPGGKKQHKKERVIYLYHDRKSRQQDVEAAGHTAPKIRKQSAMNTHAQCSDNVFLVMQPKTQAEKWYHPRLASM